MVLGVKEITKGICSGRKECLTGTVRNLGGGAGKKVQMPLAFEPVLGRLT